MPEENGRFSARESEFFEFHSSSILVPRDHDALSLGIRLGFFTRLLSTPLSLSLSLWIPSSQHLLLRKPHRIRLFFLSLGLDLPPFVSGPDLLSLSFSTALTGIRESPWFTVTGIWKCFEKKKEKNSCSTPRVCVPLHISIQKALSARFLPMFLPSVCNVVVADVVQAVRVCVVVVPYPRT